MRIEEKSCFIDYNIVKGKEYAYLQHFKEIWDNGYSIDDHFFSSNAIGYEDAAHFGVNLDKVILGTRILKRYYDRWVKKADDCKLKIESMANKYSTPHGKQWSVGDYLYFPMKEIFAEEDAKEAEEYPDEYVEEENKYTGPSLYLVLVENNDPQDPQGITISVGPYSTDFEDEPSSINYFLDYIDKSRLISKEVFEKAKDLISKTSSEIMSEIRKKYKDVKELSSGSLIIS